MQRCLTRSAARRFAVVQLAAQRLDGGGVGVARRQVQELQVGHVFGDRTSLYDNTVLETGSEDTSIDAMNTFSYSLSSFLRVLLYLYLYLYIYTQNTHIYIYGIYIYGIWYIFVYSIYDYRILL